MTLKWMCKNCGAIIGYLGWFFTKLRIPLIEHKCKDMK